MNKKVAYFTDTFFEINGVAKTSQALLEQCIKEKRDFKFITCYPNLSQDNGLTNFKPFFSLPLPYYPELKVSFCNFFAVLSFCKKEKFDIIYAPTPGILGIYALIISKILSLPLVSAFHTDFAAYMQKYTGSKIVAKLSKMFLMQTYNRSKRVLCPSKTYEEILINSGVESGLIKKFSRGANKRNFHPSFRDPFFWSNYFEHKDKTPIILYVGRISDEKNVTLFAEIAEYFIHTNIKFVMVGDGPARKTLEILTSNIYFTGYLTGVLLSKAYASSDIFLFPSQTETFGNVVLEAASSGLCPIVSSIGASCEHITHGINGFVATSLDDYIEILENLLSNPQELSICRQNAAKSVENIDANQLLSEMLDYIELKD